MLSNQISNEMARFRARETVEKILNPTAVYKTANVGDIYAIAIFGFCS